MKRILTLLILTLVAYVGFLYYQQNLKKTANSRLSVTTNSIRLTQPKIDLSRPTEVLGAATSNFLGFLNTATGGEAEPLINRTLENLQNEVKDLPREQYEKVKYEFCKDVVDRYESASTQK
jgi:hypothetical protein